MTFQESDLAALKKALLSGTKSVSMSGRTVVFQDLKEIKKLIQEIEAKIKADEETAFTPVSKNIVGTFTK